MWWVDPGRHDALPPDAPTLPDVLPRADVHLHERVQVAVHPTLTRVGYHNGRCDQRLVTAPGVHAKLYGGRLASGRAAAVCCAQVCAAVVRSQERGRVVIVIVDHFRIHTVAGSRLARQVDVLGTHKQQSVGEPAPDSAAPRPARAAG